MKQLFKQTVTLITIVSILSSVCSLPKRTYDSSDKISYNASVWLFADDREPKPQKEN